MKLEWNESFSTGVAEIDDQHKELVRQLNALYAAMAAGQGKDEIGKILGFLGKYAVMHFGKEESCMEQHRCPAAAANKQAHADFIELFGSMQKRFEKEGPTSTLAVELQQKTSNWLVNHILRVDTKLRTCVLAKPVV
ncbi:MAG: hemerythrin family protein [Anaerolineales bacterium]|nr:hemerythrin family protein [Anaerolineales bacterium]